MVCETVEEYKGWLQKSQLWKGLDVSTEGDGELVIPSAGASCVSFPWPSHPRKATYTARLAAMIDTDDEGLFYGGSLWISLSTIGSPQLEKSGWKIIERMRASFGEQRPLQTAPVHYFRADELVELTAFLVPCFVYQWNAFYLNASHDTFVFISHDEWWCAVTRDSATRTRLLGIEGAVERPELLRHFQP